MTTPLPFEFFGRQRELDQISTFLHAPGPGLTYLRGRRRIGKTELLKRVAATRDNCFYFMGREDESTRKSTRRFATEWDRFTGRRALTRLKVSELTWDVVFEEVGRHAATQAEAPPFAFLLDEVQWLAKRGGGFCGLIKEHWAEWKRPGRFKLILSGSSNHFFHRFTDGETAVLRGLKTHATIWVRPFSLSEIRQYYFSRWSDEEICLVTMMLGGVPYYLENIRPEDNFIRAVNRSVFCRDTLFLEEVDAMLKIETSAVGARRRVREVLACLGQDGATEATIVQGSGHAQDTVHRVLQRLLDYGIVRERRPLGRVKRNRSGVRFYMDDFFLNFYFQVLAPLENRIRGNERGQLFPVEILGSKRGYYIPDFSGKAFELLLARVLARGCDDESERNAGLFDRLGLTTGRYRWGTYWVQGQTQIDLVVEGLDDREVRIIEAKWTNQPVHADPNVLDQVLSKRHRPSTPGPWRTSHHLVLSGGCSSSFQEQADAQGMGVIELSDLF